MTFCLDSHSTMEHKPERLSAVSTGYRIQHDVKVYVALFNVQAHMYRKDDIFRKRQPNHYDSTSFILKKEED